MRQIEKVLELTAEDVDEYEYIVDYQLNKHHPDEITQHLYLGLKEKEECLSSVVLKLFDLLLEKDFGAKVVTALVLKHFRGFPK